MITRNDTYLLVGILFFEVDLGGSMGYTFFGVDLGGVYFFSGGRRCEFSDPGSG